MLKTGRILTGWCIALAICCHAFTTETAKAQTTLGCWNFNGATQGGPASLARTSGTCGTCTLTTTFSSPVANTGSAIGACGTDIAGLDLTLAGQANNGQVITFQLNMTGAQDLILTMATRKSTNGFNSNQVSYSIGGNPFVNLGLPYDPTLEAYALQYIDLSAISATDNQPDVRVRITFNGASSGTGNNRIDNAKFQVNGLIGPSGACCLLDGTCQIRAAANCLAPDELYQGDDSTCLGSCIARGACCLTGPDRCELQTQAACATAGGFFYGNGVSCTTPAVSCPANFSDVKINEVRIDEPVLSDDPNEYTEIVGTPGRSLSGLTYIVLGDQTSAVQPDNSGWIEHATSLQGKTIPADGHFLIAQSTFALSLATPNSVDLVVPDTIFDNNDNVTHMLVAGSTAGVGTDVDVDDNCAIDAIPPWAFVVDRIAIIFDPFNSLTECHYGTGAADTIGPDIVAGGVVPFHVYRLPDAGLPWLIGPQSPLFGVDTPGTTNDTPPFGACCYVDQFNATQCNDQLTQAQCTDNLGTYQGIFKGNGTTCVTGRCEGACCLFVGGCEVKRQADCTAVGNYQGDTTVCGAGPPFAICVCNNIAEVRALACNNGNCNLGVRLCGAVISNEMDTINSLNVASFQLQDNSGPAGAPRAITVFGSSTAGNPLIPNIIAQAAQGDPPGPAQGRQLDIQGSLDVFNGLVELGNGPPNTLQIISVNGHPGTPAPTVITAASLQDGVAAAEELESVYVQLNCVAFTDPYATGGVLTGGTSAAPGNNYTMTDGTNTFTARVPLCCAAVDYEGVAIPKGVLNIRGMVTQFDGTDPRNGLYQVILRDIDDFDGLFAPPDPLPANCPNTGACCIGGPDCRDGLTEALCNAVGGQFQGVGTTCIVVGSNCPDNLTVKINEVRVSNPDVADVDEYFELKGPPNTPLTNLHYLVIGDGSAALTSGVLENVISLAGKKLDANGFFLAANATLTIPAVINQTLAAATLENDDNVTHMLVAGFTGTVNSDLDTNDDCTLDLQPWTSVRDMIAIIKENNPPTTTECHYGPPTVGPSGTTSPAHVLRCPPTDVWVIGTPEALSVANGGNDTPGTANPNVCPCQCPADRNVDNKIDGRDVRLYVQMLQGSPASYDVCADFDLNGVVNELDIPEFVRALLAGGSCTGDPSAVDRVRVATYNLLAYTGTASQARKNAFKQIMSALIPDVLVAEEVNSVGGAQDFRDNVLNAFGGPGGYLLADYTGPLAGNALYYRSAKITYAGAPDHGTVSTEPRITDWWKLGVQGQGATKNFYVYGAHLKAGDGGVIDPPSLLTNAIRRNNAAVLIRAHADTLAGAQIIVAGDLNFYNPNNNVGDPDANPNETGWATFLTGGVAIGQVVDPLASIVNWHKNGTQALIHTQSPHQDNNTPGSPAPPGVVGGGMDDRFDFMLINSELAAANTVGLSYVAGTYRSFGNDGLHYDNDINDTPLAPYGDALHAASDHIPVVMELLIRVP